MYFHRPIQLPASLMPQTEPLAKPSLSIPIDIAPTKAVVSRPKLRPQPSAKSRTRVAERTKRHERRRRYSESSESSFDSERSSQFSDSSFDDR
ncbi:unnamed protein product [Oikopleura dioica]|uniref:Uncharacterized protein n=1 Tax=Oikopleura dioica TaxID=34765 RepID=E4XNH0_OIKDI|nr:unnamed protein product [Oikopleura dioica]